jgi:hypothetical protein
MFKPGLLYRFNINRDVGFEVHKAFYVKEKKLWKLKVGWWNIGACHEPWPMGIPQNLVVGEHQLEGISKINHNFRVPSSEYAPLYFSPPP